MTFENFKAEAVTQAADFSAHYEINTYHRVGLRYPPPRTLSCRSEAIRGESPDGITDRREVLNSLHSPEFSSIHFGSADGKRRKLEACLGEIIVACEGMAPAIKQAREEKAEAERRWAEERKREAEAAARKAEYERKARAVKKLAEDWHERRLIKDFAQALQQASSASDVPDDLRKELQTMIEWTTGHADYVDPLTDLNWTIGQFKNPRWF